jgi:glycosyltransferase involved in cell wall biosynthesis
MDVELLTVGGVPRETVARYMQACDALLVTSKHESGPAMVKEALACNLRVVSLDVGDVRERIANLPGSVLCEDDRADTVAAGLLQSLSYEGPFDGRVAVADVLQDLLTERLLAIYDELAG